MKPYYERDGITIYPIKGILMACVNSAELAPSHTPVRVFAERATSESGERRIRCSLRRTAMSADVVAVKNVAAASVFSGFQATESASLLACADAVRLLAGELSSFKAINQRQAIWGASTQKRREPRCPLLGRVARRLRNTHRPYPGHSARALKRSLNARRLFANGRSTGLGARPFSSVTTTPANSAASEAGNWKPTTSNQSRSVPISSSRSTTAGRYV